MPTTVLHAPCSIGGSCGQQPPSDPQLSAVAGAGGGRGLGLPDAAGGGVCVHCAAQLDCLHALTAWLACEHPGDDMSVAAHCSRLLPLQMQRVNSAQVDPTVWMGPAQLVAMQLRHASFAWLGSALPKHPTMSVFGGCARAEPGAAAVASCGALEAAPADPDADADDGEEVAGGGADPHAIVQPVARTTRIDVCFPAEVAIRGRLLHPEHGQNQGQPSEVAQAAPHARRAWRAQLHDDPGGDERGARDEQHGADPCPQLA
jgi:hypothetical protein